tara:strand:- start:712 stop:1428 length:717 start_codon:yes stop_codon:yes gene_type:complete
MQFSVADGYAIYEIVKINKRTIRLRWVDDPEENPDNYMDQVLGQEGTLDKDRALAMTEWDDNMNDMRDDHADFYATLKEGQILHYHGGFGEYTRCRVVLKDGEPELLPIALVGEWKDYDLPSWSCGEIHYGYHAEQIINGETMTPNYSNIYEAPDFHDRYKVNPNTFEPIDLTPEPPAPKDDPKNAKMTALERVEKYRIQGGHVENVVQILCQFIDEKGLSHEMMELTCFSPEEKKVG